MKNCFLTIFLILTIKLSFSQNQHSTSYPDSINKKRLHAIIAIESGTYLSGIFLLSSIWYKDHENVPFHLYNDSKGYLQMDKAGHAYAAYKESFAAYYALRSAGVSKKKALIYGGPIGLIFQTPIEVLDGLHEGWGFSWYDMGANAFGSSLFMAQEAMFNEQIVLMKFSYLPSIYPKYHSTLGESHLESFFLDYNAHTYWLSGNINKITGSKNLPKWANIAFGYSANGMIYEFNNPTYYNNQPFPHFERYRQYLLSLDVDFTRIPTKKVWIKKVFKTLNLIKLPFPAIEFNRIEGVKFRPLYF